MRSEEQQRAPADRRTTAPPPYPGTPRWVKVSGIVAGGLIALAAIIMLAGIGGPHGPGRHMRSGDTGGRTSAQEARP
jgi:hypothetical protein